METKDETETTEKTESAVADPDDRAGVDYDREELLNKLESEQDPEDMATLWEPDVGDIVMGRIIQYEERKDKFGNDKMTLIVRGEWIRDGETAYRGDITVWINWAVLEDLFNRKAPDTYDEVAIKRLPDQEGDSHSYRMFKMSVQRNPDSEPGPFGEGDKELDDIPF